MIARPAIYRAAILALVLVGCESGGEHPARRPGQASLPHDAHVLTDPSPAIEPRLPAGPFTVIAVGDVMMGKLAQPHIAEHGLDYPFAGVKELFESHDIAIANLEAPITDRQEEDQKWKRYHFKVDTANAEALTRSGIDVVSLANNHAMDYGEKGLLDTVMALDGWNIRHAGAGGDLDTARAPVRMQAGGTEVVILAYCDFEPSRMHALDDRPGVAQLDPVMVVEDVKAAKTPDNVVLVLAHWGVQHTDRATAGQVEVAHEILDAGADVIIGHHPHRPQEIEVRDGKLVAYSLGNFLFGYFNPKYRNNIALVLEFREARLVGARLLPIDGKNARIHFSPRLLTGRWATSTLGHVARISSRFGTSMRIHGDEATIDLAGLK